MKLSAVIISVCMLCGLSAIVAYSWPSAPRKQAMEQQEAAKLIKAWMTRSKEALEVDTDRYPDLLKQAEEMAANNSDPAADTHPTPPRCQLDASGHDPDAPRHRPTLPTPPDFYAPLRSAI